MQITVLAFGQVAGVIGNSLQFNQHVDDTDSLKKILQHKYPSLAEMKYSLAIDKKLIHENTALNGNGNVTVALLPPFSGG